MTDYEEDGEMQDELDRMDEQQEAEKQQLLPLGSPPKPSGLGAIKCREYQTEAVDCLFESWLEYNAVLIVMATGLGKTVMAAEVIQRHPGGGRILFIAHIQELIYQAQKTIAYHTGEQPAIEMGLHRDEEAGHPVLDRTKVLVASVQTMNRRLEKFDPTNFDLVIIDEFHHAAAATYRKLWKYFSSRNPAIKLLGITATADRTDNLSLKCLAEHCCFEYGIREGIDDGWLVGIEQKYIVVDGLDFSKCRTVAKDLNEKDLESAMMPAVDDGMTDEQRQEAQEKQERMLHAVAAPSVDAAAGKPGLVFCVTVAHAARMAEILRRYNVSAEVVHGKTPYENRKEIVDKFKSGKVQFLVGVGCFTEGFDAPNVAVIVMARPTKSRMLYTQMIGRGTRPLPDILEGIDEVDGRLKAIASSGKRSLIVLDFVGNSGKHKLISTADVLAGDMPEQYVTAAIEEMKETGKAEDIRKVAWRKKEEHDKEVARREEEQRKAKEKARQEAQARAEAKRAKLKAEADWHAKEIDPFSTDETAPEQIKPKYRGGASDAMVRTLIRLGIPAETAEKWTASQAGAIIGKLKAQTGSRYIMRFGKFMGQELRNIPTDYLRWMARDMKDDGIQMELEKYRCELREGKAPRPPK